MKKPSMVSFLITLLLAAAFCTHGKEPVKDTAGNQVKAGEQYFIQPVKPDGNNGGGLVPAAISVFRFCPLGITQSLLSNQPGLPVSFGFLSSVTDTIVNTSTDVTIEFKSEIWPFCKDFSKLWAVDDESSSAGEKPPIVIGGKPEQPNSQFKIEKAGERADTYKLTSLTGTVGVSPGIWGTQLVLTNDDAKTILVKIKKVNNDASTATTSTSRVEKFGLRMFPFY
ncbi:unnamed protein product [Thlaspi arvense]|uniref:Cysteine protease inhibitor WSCP-like n=1 Tax=Thlaspi arvense TaxID=13288 RepID=A0AAU9SN33_THLAR|nr:unnamed protein product [Thlaspi arvense]